MNNFSILTYDKNLSIVVDPQATEFIPIVFKSGNLYDPKHDFRPLKAKKNQKSLCTEHRNIAKKLIEEASKVWKAPSAPSPTPAPVTPSPTPTPALTTPQSTLDALIAESVAKIAVGQVMESAKPALDAFIQKTYGMLPQVVEIKTPTETKKITGIVNKEFDTVLKIISRGHAAFLTGPAGCGKNVICKQVAEALGLEFYFSNAVTQEYKLTGFIDANGNYHETQFYKAFTKGGLFMLDEIDASIPEVLIILNAALANGYFDFPNLGRVQAHKDFHVIAAGNTLGTGADIEYTGRFQLDAASLDRFTPVEITYDTNVEKALAHNDSEMVAFIHSLRAAIKKSDVKYIVSYRAIERLVDYLLDFDIEKAMKLAVVKGMDRDDVKMISKNMGDNTNKYFVAFNHIANNA